MPAFMHLQHAGDATGANSLPPYHTRVLHLTAPIELTCAISFRFHVSAEFYFFSRSAYGSWVSIETAYALIPFDSMMF